MKSTQLIKSGLKRAFASSTTGHKKAIFPHSMHDAYEIMPTHQVPADIIRPPYVGKKPQNMPPLHGQIQILDKEGIKGLRVAANLAARTLKHGMDSAEVGMSLEELDKIVHDYIISDNAYPSAIDFMHFPKSVCLSVNDVVSHGVPNTYVLKAGDYLNIDVVCYKDGHHGDNSGMVFLEDEVTTCHADIKRLSRVTREAMFAAIDVCKPGTRYDKIADVIEDYAAE
jgi:methionyl aminopeptidase